MIQWTFDLNTAIIIYSDEMGKIIIPANSATRSSLRIIDLHLSVFFFFIIFFFRIFSHCNFYETATVFIFVMSLDKRIGHTAMYTRCVPTYRRVFHEFRAITFARLIIRLAFCTRMLNPHRLPRLWGETQRARNTVFNKCIQNLRFWSLTAVIFVCIMAEIPLYHIATCIQKNNASDLG